MDYFLKIQKHLADDIYHQSIQLNFLHFIRHDIKFESLEKLTEQLSRDKESTLAFFEK